MTASTVGNEIVCTGAVDPVAVNAAISPQAATSKARRKAVTMHGEFEDLKGMPRLYTNHPGRLKKLK
jgi:hypothetical protein